MLGRLACAIRSLAIFLTLTAASGIISLVLLPDLRDYSWDVYLVLQGIATAALSWLFLRQRVDTHQFASRVADRLRQRKVDMAPSGPRSGSDILTGDAIVEERP